MTLSKRLLAFVAPLCFTVACATSPSDESNDTSETAAEISQPGATTNGASCILHLPFRWGGHCSSGFSGTRTIPDGQMLDIPSQDERGECVFTCDNGTLNYDCTCN